MYIPSVLIVGNGYLGNRLGGAMCNTQVSHERIVDVRETVNMFQRQGGLPDVVINCVKHRTVSNAADDPHAVLLANVSVPIILAEACHASGSFLIHLSTDCVFSGPKPDGLMWTEADQPQPNGLYARSKAAADMSLCGLDNVAIVRFRSPIDHVPSPRNFLDRLASFPVVSDVEYNVTFMDDLIGSLKAIAAKRLPGIYHVFNLGKFSHRDFLLRYRELVDANHRCQWHTPNQAPELRDAGAERFFAPSKRLERLNLSLRSVQTATEDTLEKYAANVRKRRSSHPQPT